MKKHFNKLFALVLFGLLAVASFGVMPKPTSPFIGTWTGTMTQGTYVRNVTMTVNGNGTLVSSTISNPASHIWGGNIQEYTDRGPNLVGEISSNVYYQTGQPHPPGGNYSSLHGELELVSVGHLEGELEEEFFSDSDTYVVSLTKN